MILETAKEQYKNRTRDSEFKCFHWCEVLKHQPKWRAKSTSSLSTNPWISSSDHAGDEEVTHPMGQVRAKAATWKGKQKGKEGSSSQTESFSAVGGMMSTLEKLRISFAKVQLWKQWNKLKECSTTNMDEEEVQTHREAFRLIQKDLQFTQANEAAVEDEDDQ
jgi:hypothetical protein